VPALRLALAASAVVACAWFVLGIVQSHDQSRADALIHQPGTPTATQTARILSLLRSAATLNPDRDIDLLRAQAQTRGGQPAAAEREMKEVVRDEPMNVDAWIVLGVSAGRRDPATASLARVRERALAPPVPAGG
jgi:predicted Zn-dependent protease